MSTDLYQKFENSRFYKYFGMLLSEVDKLAKADIDFYFFQTPLRQNIKGLSEFELERLENWQFDFNHISEKDCEIIKEIYPDDVTLEYLKQVYDGSRVYQKNGVKYFADFRSKYVNVVMGKRLTFYQPDVWQNRIYIYGQCTARGTGVEDRHTIASFLQNGINRQHPGLFQVVNLAAGCGSDLYDDIRHMKETCFKRGDKLYYAQIWRLFQQNYLGKIMSFILIHLVCSAGPTTMENDLQILRFIRIESAMK